MKTTKTIMTMAFSAMCCASLFATTLASAGGVSFVRSSSLAFGFDSGNGRVVKIVAADGTELSPNVAVDLFRMQLTRTDDFSVDESVSSAKAARFRQEPLDDGLRPVWEDLDGKHHRVECTVRGSTTLIK